MGGWKLDAATLEVSWTDETYRVHGVPHDYKPTLEEAIDFFHPEDRDRLKQAIQRALDHGEPYDMEIRFITAEGKHLWTRTICNPEITNGKTVRLHGTFQDITDLKKTRDALRESEEHFRQLAETIKEVFWVSSPDWNELYYISPAYELVWGLSCNSLYKNPKSWLDVVHELDREKVISSIPVRATIGSEVVFPEYRIVRPDNSIRWIFSRAYPIRNDWGEVYRIAGIAEDITERKLAEEKLRDSDETFRNFAENPFVGIFRTSIDDGTFLYSNQKNAEIIGYDSPQDLIGKVRAADHYPSEVRAKLLDILQKDGKVENFEFELVLNNGTRKNISTSVQLWAEKGFLEGVILDITERKRSEEEKKKLQDQLAQAQKMESVGRLAGGIAHDFNNMLSVIFGHTEIALLHMDRDHPLHTSFQEIKKAAKHSADITRQLLTFARKQTIALKVLDLNEAVEKMLNMLQRLIGENINLVWAPEKENLWPIKMDPSQIDQILANLCVNARDAIDGVGKITIETGKASFDQDYCANNQGFVPGDFVLLTISDDGSGMDRHTLESIFDPFFTTKDMEKGTGLGLATVYGIVKQNNGFIHVFSEPNQGSTFKLYLPRYQIVKEQVIDKRLEPSDIKGSETILVVEDEPSILEMITIMLERLGYTVMTAITPGQAIDFAAKHGGPIHLLITDVIMPQMNGRELAGNLSSIFPNLRCLFMSGYTADIIAHHGILAEGVDYLQKPFSIKDMAVKVRKILNGDEA